MLHPLAIGIPMIPSWNDPHGGLRPFVAEVWLILTIVGVLLTPFFAKKPNVACALVALSGLVAALISLLSIGMGPDVVGWRFAGMLVSDPFAILWKTLLLVFAICIVLMWFATSAASMHEGDGPEFFTLLLGATLGMSLMASTSNLLMLVIAIEMASLPSYVLAGFRKTDRIGAEASLKYVLFGAATSAIMIYGVSILYGLYGTLQLDGTDGLAARMAHSAGGSALLTVAIFGLIVGIGFKISAVPFHFWCPDVFEGAGIDVSAFLSVASKGAALVLLLRVVTTIAVAIGYKAVGPVPAIAAVVGIIGAVTATVGNTGEFVQRNIKRLLAYSSIAHAGYMLCVVSMLYRPDPMGPDPGPMAAQALLLYLAVYLFMNLGAFTVAGLIENQTGSEKIADYAGLWRRSPMLAVCMAAFMFSLVGLPPFAGFVAKLNIMVALARNGGWWWTLVVVIGVNTIFSLYFYLRVVRLMYLSGSDLPVFSPNLLGSGIAVMCAAALLLLFLGFGPLSKITSRYGSIYTNVAAPAGVVSSPLSSPPAPSSPSVAAVVAETP